MDRDAKLSIAYWQKLIRTSVTQQGPFFLEELGRKNPGGLYRYHQEWVESLARAAETEAARTGG
jgi:hypothetical protein